MIEGVCPGPHAAPAPNKLPEGRGHIRAATTGVDSLSVLGPLSGPAQVAFTSSMRAQMLPRPWPSTRRSLPARQMI